MKKMTIGLGLAVMLLSASCSAVKKTVTTETMNIIKTDVVTKPQVAELSIEYRKIEGVAEVRVKEYYPNAREACISFALKDAITKGNCDIVVQPNYEIEETKSYIRVKVTGFAGYYKKFRDLQDSDTTAFKVYEKISGVVKTNVATPGNTVKTTTTQKKGKGLVGGIIAAILLPIIIIIAAS